MSPLVTSVTNKSLSVVIDVQPPSGGFLLFEIAYRDSDNVRTLVTEVATIGEYEITGLDPSSDYVVEVSTIVGTGADRLTSLPAPVEVTTG